MKCTDLRRLFFYLLVLLLPLNAIAQDPDDSEEWDEDPEEVPIDGGVSLLIAAGAGYGLKKIHELRKKKENDNGIDPPGK
jgi:hypothetical protein